MNSSNSSKVAGLLHRMELEKSLSEDQPSSGLLTIKEEMPSADEINSNHLRRSQDKKFWPERPPKEELGTHQATSIKANTVLTNLQRGNIPTMQTIVMEPEVASIHQRAGQGEIKAAELNPENVDQRDHRRRTPLMWSAYYGQTPTVNRLLQYGADPLARGDEDETPLHLAASGGHHDVLRVLLSAGCPADVEDENACTPLMFAAVKNHPHCVNELLLAGADVTRSNVNGDSALGLSMKGNCQRSTAVLEQHLLNMFRELKMKE